jgi:hypothetical protein
MQSAERMRLSQQIECEEASTGRVETAFTICVPFSHKRTCVSLFLTTVRVLLDAPEQRAAFTCRRGYQRKQQRAKTSMTASLLQQSEKVRPGQHEAPCCLSRIPKFSGLLTWWAGREPMRSSVRLAARGQTGRPKSTLENEGTKI